MAHLCDCGEELVVNVSDTKRTTYCQGCGREHEETLQQVPRGSAPVISIQRAKILQQIKSPPPAKEQKKVKQLRDRTDYTKARRMR